MIIFVNPTSTYKYHSHDDDDDEYGNFYGAITQHMPLQGALTKNPSYVRDMISGSSVFSLDLNDSRMDIKLLILWMLGCYSSTAVRQQKRLGRRNRFSIFELLDRPSPQIADVLPLSLSTPQRSMISDSLAQPKLNFL